MQQHQQIQQSNMYIQNGSVLNQTSAPLLQSNSTSLNTPIITPINHIATIIPECQACMQQINDRYYLQVMDKTWHLNCLRCIDCKLSLDSQQSCFAKDGLIFCKDDYFKYGNLFILINDHFFN